MQYRFTISGEQYELDTDALFMDECLDIEKVTGDTYRAWLAALGDGSMLALKAGLWIAVRRKQPDLTFSAFNFNWSDFDVVEDEDPTQAPDGAPTPN
jgi:hypothetical protein